MKLNKRLKLVVPVERDDGTMAYVHAEPIGEASFDQYYMIIGQAFAQLYSSGLGLFAGPRITAKLIKSLAEKQGIWEGADGVELGLFGNIRRLASFVIPKASGGWEPVPLEEAITRELISREDVSEVENALAFFTVASSMHKRTELPAVLMVVSRIWDAQTSSLNSTEFSASLATSTAIESSGAKATPSLIPH